MKPLKLKPVKSNLNILQKLEKKGLIRLLKPSKKVLKAKPGKGVVDIIYKSSPAFGPHMLMCIGKSETKPEMSYHYDNEEIMLIKQKKHKIKPLYLVIALSKYAVIERKLKEKNLTERDFMAIELEYNNPETSFITILKNTFHCEVTLPGKGTSPYFFVAEPAAMTSKKVKLQNYTIELEA